MRVAFHGKGGSGKTTTTAGFVKYAARFKPFVLAIDADLNNHLQESLAFPGLSKPLGDSFDEVANYLKGERTDIGARPVLCTLPPSLQSRFVRVTPSDAFIREYCLTVGNVSLLTVGTYRLSDVGTTCYHEKLKPLMAVFHHMLDQDNDLVVTDTIAGTDNISTSLSFAYDLNIFVVEPTEKSIQVYDDYVALVPQYADRVFVVGNKITDSEDLKFIAERVPKRAYLGSVPFSKNLKQFEQGDVKLIGEFHAEQEPVFERIFEVLQSRKRDWPTYLKTLRAIYKWDCERWYSDFHKCDLQDSIDQAFTYEAVLTMASGNKSVALAT